MGRISQFFDDIDEKIPNSIKSIAEFLANAFGVITTVGSAFIIRDVTMISSDQTATQSQKSLVIAVVLLSLSVLFLLYRIKRADQKRLDERKLCSTEYYRFLHDYRNQINDLERTYKQGDLNDKLLVVTVTNLLEKALDSLSNIFICILLSMELCYFHKMSI